MTNGIKRKALAGLAFLAAPLLVAATEALGRTGAHELDGRYAMDLRLATLTRVPIVGRQLSVTSSLVLVDMRQDAAGRWVQRQRVCQVRVESEKMRMTVPDAFVSALPVREHVPAVQDAPGGARYVADLGPESIGFDPRMTGGRLPHNREAPGVLDSDRDGEPGATVIGHFPLFGSVRLYIAQRTHLVLRGRQTSPGRIEGTLDIRAFEQKTLGADSRLFRRTLDTRGDPSHSGFTMVRTRARTCGELTAEARTLFDRKYAE